MNSNFLKKSPLLPGITPKQALEIARSKGYELTYATMIKWVRTYGIGKKVGGRFYIDRDKLLYLLKFGNH